MQFLAELLMSRSDVWWKVQQSNSSHKQALLKHKPLLDNQVWHIFQLSYELNTCLSHCKQMLLMWCSLPVEVSDRSVIEHYWGFMPQHFTFNTYLGHVNPSGMVMIMMVSNGSVSCLYISQRSILKTENYHIIDFIHFFNLLQCLLCTFDTFYRC